MNDNLNDQTLDAIKETNASIRDLIGAVGKGMQASELRDAETSSQISALTTAISNLARNNRKESTGSSGTLIGVAGIMFGLMTPLYLMITGVSAAVTSAEAQLRLHNSRAVEAAARFSGLSGSLVEIETQFRNDRFRLDVIDARMLRDDEREAQDIKDLATIKEKLKDL